MVKNGQKWPKIEFSGKWWENEVVIACSSYLFADTIATAPSDNSFVNKSRRGMKGLPSSRDKWCKMAKNKKKGIFWKMVGEWSSNSLE